MTDDPLKEDPRTKGAPVSDEGISPEMLTLDEALRDALARVEIIVHLETMCPDGDMSSEVRDLLLWEDDIHKLLAWPSESMSAEDFEGWLEEELGYWMSRHPNTWLVKVATPIRSRFKDNGCSFSWGNYRTHWTQATTYENAVRAGIAWAEAEEQRQRERAQMAEQSTSYAGENES